MREPGEDDWMPEVSIPFRYAENIKRLDTATHCVIVSIPFRSAENGSGGGDIYVYIGFQFLLGTLKTKRAGTWLFFLIAVSIPFRYAENCY